MHGSIRLAGTVLAAAAFGLTALTAPAQAAPAAPAPAAAPAAIELPSRPATPAEVLMLAAEDGHGCNGSENSNNSYVHVCFERSGDVIWVYDDESDGERAIGHLVVRSGHYFCPNAAGAGVRWVACGYGSQVAENETVLYFGTTRNGATGTDHHETSWQYEPAS